MGRNKKNKKFLYELLAEEIQLKISQQIFKPGEKLPFDDLMENAIKKIGHHIRLSMANR